MNPNILLYLLLFLLFLIGNESMSNRTRPKIIPFVCAANRVIRAPRHARTSTRTLAGCRLKMRGLRLGSFVWRALDLILIVASAGPIRSRPGWQPHRPKRTPSLDRFATTYFLFPKSSRVWVAWIDYALCVPDQTRNLLLGASPSRSLHRDTLPPDPAQAIGLAIEALHAVQ